MYIDTRQIVKVSHIEWTSFCHQPTKQGESGWLIWVKSEPENTQKRTLSILCRVQPFIWRGVL